MNEVQLKLQFGEIANGIREWGLTNRDLEDLPSVQLIKNVTIFTNRTFTFQSKMLQFTCSVFFLVIMFCILQCFFTSFDLWSFVGVSLGFSVS